jgi:glucan biosynthesis protein
MLVLLGAGAASMLIPFSPGTARETTGFSRQVVLDMARILAARSFEQPAASPKALSQLDYKTYRKIRYRKDAAVWGASPTRFSIELFAPGFLYRDLIDIAIVENGHERPLTIGEDSFEAPDPKLAKELRQAGKFAGFRLHYPLNRDDYRDEFAVFQGASYFRCVSAGQIYGLSARGLGVDTAQPNGEEFPLFRKFWIERPSRRAKSIVVHALLDSESVAGAYRFGIYPGRPTRVDVEASLFPRRPLNHVGLAPLTSMFFFGPLDRSDNLDYRPAVHDSQGLAILTGHDEAIWRPLLNPTTLQVSAFMDTSPKGFGLIQRSRDFGDYEDLEADYGRRPSAWVRPLGDWGEGHVELLEIPSDSETNDNIVAYWRPKASIPEGQQFDYAYVLSWSDDVPDRAMARAVHCALGQRLADGLPQAVIDYDTNLKANDITLDVSATAGAIRETVLHDNDERGGVRIFLTFDPGDAQLVELRVQPKQGDTPIGETWLYRWLAS